MLTKATCAAPSSLDLPVGSETPLRCLKQRITDPSCSFSINCCEPYIRRVHLEGSLRLLSRGSEI